MKSAEEWCNELEVDLDHAAMFRAIQADALRQGMLDAAKIVRPSHPAMPVFEPDKAIQSAADEGCK